MKKGKILLLCVLILLGAGCAVRGNRRPQERAYELYFRAADLEAAAGGDAIGTERSAVLMETELEAAELAERLMAELLQGPDGVELQSPFPEGTELRSVRVSAGRAIVDMTAAYGALSGVELSMADYCIVLTLTQIPEVRSVTITVNNQFLTYRSAQTFTARDVLISSAEDVVATVEAVLYFCNEHGTLVPVRQVLELYEGDTRAETLVAALAQGPEEKELLMSLPEGFSVQNVWVKDERCYVSLSSAMLDALPEETAMKVPVRALVKSLLSLENVAEVQFLVDGEATESIRGVNVSRVFVPGMV